MFLAMEQYLLSCSPAFMITTLLFIFMLLIMWKKSKPKRKVQKLPPTPWKLPVIGNIHQLIGSLPQHRLKDLANKYGPVMHIQLGEISAVIVSSPEVAEEILKTHNTAFAERPATFTADALCYNCRDMVYSPYGGYWRQMRKICVLELLSPKRVQSFGLIMEEEVSRVVGSIISSGAGLIEINLSKMIYSLSNCIISKTAFGKLNKQHDEFLPIAEKITQFLGGFHIGDAFPSMKLLHVITGIGSKLKNLHQQADMIIESIIKEHRAQSKATAKVDEADNIVDVLLNLQDQGNLEIPITKQIIQAIILDVFVAGSETSAGIITWAMSEMLRNPRVMKKAQTEVRQVYHGKPNIDGSSLHELKYLKLALKETLRLHPPLPLLPRQSRETVEINGFEIPAKTQLIINVWAIGRDPRHWIDADKFNPERFSDRSIDYKGTDFELIPFGSGRRMCPGMLFGMTVVELTLANLLYHFDWKLPGGMESENIDMSEQFGITVRRKNDLYAIPFPHSPLSNN